MTRSRKPSVHQSWAHLRFSVVGQLLAAPPPRGELQGELERLAAKKWLNPATGELRAFGLSTIERWFNEARKAQQDPVSALRRKIRKDSGQQGSMGDALRQALLAQYAAHKGWSVQLHYDNLVALAATAPEIGAPPSYSTLHRFMKAHGLFRRRAGQLEADARSAGGRGAARCTRDPQLRGRLRERSLALGLPRRQQESDHAARGMGSADPVRRAR